MTLASNRFEVELIFLSEEIHIVQRRAKLIAFVRAAMSASLIRADKKTIFRLDY